MSNCGVCGKIGPDDRDQLSEGDWWPSFWVDEQTPGKGPLCGSCFCEYTDQQLDPLLVPGLTLPVVRGESKSKVATKELTVKVKDEHRSQLKRVALREDSSMMQLLRQALMSLAEMVDDNGYFVDGTSSFSTSFEGGVKQITFPIPKPIHTKLRIAAIRHDTTVELMFSDHLEDYIREII